MTLTYKLGLVLLTLVVSSKAGSILINKNNFENRLDYIQRGLSHFENFKDEAIQNNTIAAELVKHLADNSNTYRDYLEHISSSETADVPFPHEMKLIDPFGIPDHILNSDDPSVGNVEHESIHVLYGLGPKHKKRVKRGVPAIIGGVLGGGIGGCLGSADLFFLPVVGGLLGGFFGGGAGGGLGGIIELNPLSGPLNSVLGGLFAGILGAIGGGIGGLVGPIGGCAAGGAGGAIGGGVGTIIGTILQTLVGGPI